MPIIYTMCKCVIYMQCKRHFDVVREPMDLQPMEHKLEGGKYANQFTFRADFCLMINSCIYPKTSFFEEVLGHAGDNADVVLGGRELLMRRSGARVAGLGSRIRIREGKEACSSTSSCASCGPAPPICVRLDASLLTLDSGSSVVDTSAALSSLFGLPPALHRALCVTGAGAHAEPGPLLSSRSEESTTSSIKVHLI
ncbi:hypothetical protein K438DRAFT_1772010 [Mycena galopus ATCC 62051]|nr:hypothetical protein K438DRAFT_1772010 [Mycena galopus ATCC 62051]